MTSRVEGNVETRKLEQMTARIAVETEDGFDDINEVPIPDSLREEVVTFGWTLTDVQTTGHIVNREQFFDLTFERDIQGE